MAKHEILTLQEVESFTARLRATVVAAQESQTKSLALMSALSRLVKSGAPSVSGDAGRTRGRAAKASRGRGAKTKDETQAIVKGRRGRAPRVEDAQILEVLKHSAGNSEQAGTGGMTMRELEGALGQHVETIRLKLRALREAGQVRTSGPRNQLRYHASGESAKNGARPRGRVAAPTPAGLTEHLHSMLERAGKNGVQMNTFEAETKQPAKTIRKTLEAMRLAKQVTISGTRRSTRYHFHG